MEKNFSYTVVLTLTTKEGELKAKIERYHGKVEDATNWTQAAGLSDEMLRPSHCADITSRHEDLNAHGLPLSNTFGLITCQDNKHASECCPDQHQCYFTIIYIVE